MLLGFSLRPRSSSFPASSRPATFALHQEFCCFLWCVVGLGIVGMLSTQLILSCCWMLGVRLVGEAALGDGDGGDPGILGRREEGRGWLQERGPILGLWQKTEECVCMMLGVGMYSLEQMLCRDQLVYPLQALSPFYR